MFHGNVRKGNASGFHHRGSIGHEGHARVARGPDGQERIVRRDPRTGVYDAEVEIRNPNTGDWKPKHANSTFFPDDWSRQRVLDEVREASRDLRHIRDNLYAGTTPSGLDINLRLAPDGSITTFYPVLP